MTQNDAKIFNLNREVNNVVSRTSENCLDITEIIKVAGEDKEYLKCELDLVKNTFNDNMKSNNEKIDIKFTQTNIHLDKLNQEIITIKEHNTNFSNETSDNFNLTNENHQSLLDEYQNKSQDIDGKCNILNTRLNDLDVLSNKLQDSVNNNYDKLLVKMGDVQTSLIEQLEQAKMGRGFSGARQNKSEEDRTAKVDETDLINKLKALDMNTILGFDKFKDSVNFDIRMLKDEYLEFKNIVGGKQDKHEETTVQFEYELKKVKKRIDELADGRGVGKHNDTEQKVDGNGSVNNNANANATAHIDMKVYNTNVQRNMVDS